MTDTPRLPIPIHCKRHQQGDDHHEASPELVGEAARLLHQVQLMASTADVPVLSLTRTTAKGETVKAQVNGPLAFTTIRGVPKAKPKEPEEEESPENPQRLVWMPEGLVITPRTASAPHGYGMPPTPDGRGTTGGLLQQVVINRYKNNQYPDALYEQVVREKGGEPNENTVVVCSPFFFMDWELTSEDYGIGVTYGKLGKEPEFYPQFKSRWVPNYREPDGGRWFCHRPMHHLKETAFDRAVRDETNLYREEVGQPPLNPPLRGTTYELTAAITYQMNYSKMLAHDWDGYREGYYKFLDRVSSRSGLPCMKVGENLALAPGKPNKKDFGIRVSTGWRNSPGHYANMIAGWQGDADLPLYPTLESHALGDTRITQTIKPPSETPEELVTSGTGAAQIFHGKLDWLRVGFGKSLPCRPEATIKSGWPGDKTSDMHIDLYPMGKMVIADAASNLSFSFGGRDIPVSNEFGFTVYGIRIVSVKAIYQGDSIDKFRVALLHLDDESYGNCRLIVYEGDAEDFAGTKRIISGVNFSHTNGHAITRPVWSDSGNRMCFGYLEVHRCQEYDGQFGAEYDEVMAYSNRFVGQQIRFFELVGNSMVSLGGWHTLPYFVDGADTSGVPVNLRRECSGEIPYFPMYSEEALDFVSLEVDSWVEKNVINSYPPDPKHEELRTEYQIEVKKQVRGWLNFPSGAAFEFNRIDGYMVYETGATVEAIPEIPPITGFVCHLYPFDPAHPERMSYIRYDLPETHDADTGAVATLYLEGEAVRTADKALERKEPGIYYDGGGAAVETKAWTLFQPNYYVATMGRLATFMAWPPRSCYRGIHPFEPVIAQGGCDCIGPRVDFGAVMPTIDAFRGEVSDRTYVIHPFPDTPNGDSYKQWGYPVPYLSPASGQHAVFALPGENTAVFVAGRYAPALLPVGAAASGIGGESAIDKHAHFIYSIGGLYWARQKWNYRMPIMDYVNVGPIIINYSHPGDLEVDSNFGAKRRLSEISPGYAVEDVGDSYPYPACGFSGMYQVVRLGGDGYLLKDDSNERNRFHSIQYGNERIVAGQVTNTLGPNPLWEGDDQYFYKSTLDLKAITGFDNLLNNILPIGVI